MSPPALRVAERIVAALCAAGFSALRAFQILNTVMTFVIGHTLAEAGETPGHEDAPPDTAGLGKQLDPAEFPYFSEAIREGLGQPQDHQSRFDFALDALFAGLVFKAAVEQRK